MWNNYSVKLRIIEFGDMGFDVKTVQRLLHATGIHDDNTHKRCHVTGILDSQTVRILKKFQKRAGITVQSKVDADTFNALMRW